MSSRPDALPQTLTLDGKHYDLARLSTTARAQLPHLQFAEGQIQRLSNRNAIAETARLAYVRALADNLPEKKASANRKKNVITVDDERYWLEDFSEAARAQLYHIRVVEAEQEQLNKELAMARTARNHYVAVLKQELKGVKPLQTQ